jgi:hypothetical protein
MWIKVTLIGCGVLFALIGIGGVIIAVALDDGLWVVTFALPFLLTSFLWFGVLSRFGRIVSARDIDDPVMGTATVLGVRRTGTEINDVPLTELQLRVQLPGRPAYDTEISQLISGGMVAAGMVVPVRSERLDQDEVVVDFETGVVATGTGSAPATLAAALGATQSPPPIAGYQSIDEILATGEPGQVKVVSTFDLGGMTTPDGDPVVGMVLDVMPTGRAAYQVQCGHRVPTEHLAEVVPGSILPARIDPADPNRFAIDWGQPGPGH